MFAFVKSFSLCEIKQIIIFIERTLIKFRPFCVKCLKVYISIKMTLTLDKFLFKAWNFEKNKKYIIHKSFDHFFKNRSLLALSFDLKASKKLQNLRQFYR